LERNALTQNANSDGDRPDRSVSCADTEDARAHQDAARGERVKAAVRAAGGRRAVSSKSGIPEGTLGNYQRGRDIPSEALVALADACGVRIEWLAAGRGTMKGDWAPPQPHAPTADALGAPLPLTQASMEIGMRLGMAIREGGGEEALMERTGLASGTVAMYLAGVPMPLETLVSVARALGVSPEWLATGDAVPGAPVPGIGGLSAPSADRLRPPPVIRRLEPLLLAKAMEIVEALSPAALGKISLLERARKVVHVYELLVMPEEDLPSLPTVPDRDPKPGSDGS
jgi:transcriptional regulator with XRE-family HTH domain